MSSDILLPHQAPVNNPPAGLDRRPCRKKRRAIAMLPLLLCVMLTEPRIEPPGKAELRLVFSAKTFDPLKPGKETVKGVIINNTAKPIKVPADYDGDVL